MSDPDTLILIVDDDEFTAQLTALILDCAGYPTLIADGGLDALEKLASNPAICMVVSDVDMPMMDGITLFSEVREQGFRQPFMLLTGQDAAPIMAEHPEINAVLTKDENLQDVLPELIASLLS